MTLKVGALLLVAVMGVAAVVWLLIAPESVEAIAEKWEGSTHANDESLAFTFWSEQGLSEVPERCAKCHSTTGFRDFLGEDGTAAGTVDQTAETGTLVYCSACHNPSAHAMTEVGFPSGIDIGGLDVSAVCMQCHQGRRAGDDVRQMIGDVDPDATSPELVFVNVHYYIAASTWLGTEAKVGYEYPDRSYVSRFEHVPDVQTCVECHDPHSQRVAPERCSPCHVTVAEPGDLRTIRTSDVDYDGDGNVEEGLAGEIETMQERLYGAMQAYAEEETTALVYVGRDPFFFIDSDGDGEPDEQELNDRNVYRTWTPRLVRAAYNYHFSLQDPGNYTHNGRYVLQLLYDSLDDLGERVAVDTERLVRPPSE